MQSNLYLVLRTLQRHAPAARAGRALPSWSWERDRIGPVSSMPVVDALASDLRKARPGDFVMAHLLMPHYPYVYGANCELRQPGEWLDRSDDEPHPGAINTPDSRATRYARYFEQASCVQKKLEQLMMAIPPSLRRDAIVIIHGDHGSRISLVDPHGARTRSAVRHGFRRQLLDAFCGPITASRAWLRPEARSNHVPDAHAGRESVSLGVGSGTVRHDANRVRVGGRSNRRNALPGVRSAAARRGRRYRLPNSYPIEVSRQPLTFRRSRARDESHAGRPPAARRSPSACATPASRSHPERSMLLFCPRRPPRCGTVRPAHRRRPADCQRAGASGGYAGGVFQPPASGGGLHLVPAALSAVCKSTSSDRHTLPVLPGVVS